MSGAYRNVNRWDTFVSMKLSISFENNKEVKLTSKIRFKKTVRPEAKKEAKQLIAEYGISDAGGLILIRAIADSMTIELDSMDIVAIDGLTVTDRFGQIKSHPLCSVIRDSRAQKLAALKALNLDLEPIKPIGRPPGK